MTVHFLHDMRRGPSTALHDVGVRDTNGMQIGRGIVTERVEAVRALDAETELSLPKAVRNVTRKQMGNVALCMDPLDHEVRKKNTADRAGSFWGFNDP